MKKITEFNSLVGDELAVNMDHVKLLLDKIKKTEFYHSSTFTENEISVMIKMFKWQTEYLIPIVDTFRMALIHPASNAFLYKHSNTILSKLLEVLKNGSDTHKILVLRVFNNMFISHNNRQIMLKNRSDILDSASVYLDSENANLRSAIVSLLFK